jgi:dephospho-CoA kinase
VIDLDLIAREVVEPGKPAYQKIVAHFGKDILFPDGTLDRKKLGAVRAKDLFSFVLCLLSACDKIIFNDAEQRRLLGSFTRGPILWEMFRRLLVYFAKGTDIVVLDAPLLFESGLRRIASYIIVVSVPEELQLKRFEFPLTGLSQTLLKANKSWWS